MTEDKYNHIRQAVEFTNLVKCTLGPRGMNLMIVNEQGHKVMTNDGATIMKNVKSGHPMLDMFKDLAKSQEIAAGDGTTTAIIISGALLNNALQLIEKGIHPTIIIKGYDLANQEAIKILDGIKEKGEKDKIIKTALGSKVSPEIKGHIANLIFKVEDFDNLKLVKLVNENPLDSELYKGTVFEGFTLNDRMESECEGKVCVLDFETNLETEKFNIDDPSKIVQLENAKISHRKKIVEKLKKLDVKCLFYTDTNPAFESLLTENKIMGIVLHTRENLDDICNAVGGKSAGSLESIDSSIGEGKVKYVKGREERKGMIYVEGDRETLIIKGPTSQTLDEIERSVYDVIGLMKNSLEVVIGAGAIEIEISKRILEYAKTIGGKEQLAIEKFADAIDSIPLVLAQNCGLDAIEVLTKIKSEHEKGFTLIGVDEDVGYSDAKDRGLIEPVAVKKHAINSACNVCNLILKTDKLLIGEEKKE